MSLENESPDEMRDEYDFAPGRGVRGKYFDQYQETPERVLRLMSELLMKRSQDFHIENVTHRGGVLSIVGRAISSEAGLDTAVHLVNGDILCVIDVHDGFELGEFKVASVEGEMYRAEALVVDPVWAGQVVASGEGDPPASAIAAFVSTSA
jgi:hypothetical protein